MNGGAIVVRNLGLRDYRDTLAAMREFNARRRADTADEIWLLEHRPVYTVGLKRHGRYPANLSGVPVVETDRGGDITYHGPGQLVLYTLFDLDRRRLGVRAMVHALERAVIDLLAQVGRTAERRAGAPGVYVADRKLASLGLRIRRACSYHGLALNVDMDLAPFHEIDPCGLRGVRVTQLRDLGLAMNLENAGARLVRTFRSALMAQQQTNRAETGATSAVGAADYLAPASV